MKAGDVFKFTDGSDGDEPQLMDKVVATQEFCWVFTRTYRRQRTRQPVRLEALKRFAGRKLHRLAGNGGIAFTRPCVESQIDIAARQTEYGVWFEYALLPDMPLMFLQMERAPIAIPALNGGV